MRLKATISILLIAMLFMVSLSTAQTTAKLEASQAGTISTPQGKVAFMRDGGVWMIDITDGTQEHLCDVTNADGRLAWSPDGRQVMFTRSGLASMESPTTGEGGKHRLYDLFLAVLDSAYANNRLFWQRVTNSLGSRDPEWSPDGSRVLFYKDLNAQKVDADMPNYQICTMAPDGSDLQILRKDYANPGGEFLISPSMNAQGDLACIYFASLKPVGLVVLGKDEYMLGMATIKERAAKNVQCMAPCWSPDGKWLAYVSSNMDEAGLYLTNADFSQRYLVFKPPVPVNVNLIAPSFSPDSKWLTFSTDDGSVWICDITGNGARRLCGPGTNRGAAWSPGPK
ncbi:MAG: hypothetical protein ABIE70_01520 [bacterium]